MVSPTALALLALSLLFLSSLGEAVPRRQLIYRTDPDGNEKEFLIIPRDDVTDEEEYAYRSAARFRSSSSKSDDSPPSSSSSSPSSAEPTPKKKDGVKGILDGIYKNTLVPIYTSGQLHTSNNDKKQVQHLIHLPDGSTVTVSSSGNSGVTNAGATSTITGWGPAHGHVGAHGHVTANGQVQVGPHTHGSNYVYTPVGSSTVYVNGVPTNSVNLASILSSAGLNQYAPGYQGYAPTQTSIIGSYLQNNLPLSYAPNTYAPNYQTYIPNQGVSLPYPQNTYPQNTYPPNTYPPNLYGHNQNYYGYGYPYYGHTHSHPPPPPRPTYPPYYPPYRPPYTPHRQPPYPGYYHAGWVYGGPQHGWHYIGYNPYQRRPRPRPYYHNDDHDDRRRYPQSPYGYRPYGKYGTKADGDVPHDTVDEGKKIE